MKNYKLWFLIWVLSFGGIIFAGLAGGLTGWFMHVIVNQPEEARSPFMPFIVSTVVIAAIMIMLLSHEILRPLNQLVAALKKVANGDFDVKLSEKSEISEIRDMAKNFNKMVEELSATETLRNDFVSNVSHEFKTPLASIEGYASLMLAPDVSTGELQNYARKIMKSTKQLSTLTGNILVLSKLNAGTINEKPQLFSLDEQLREAVLSLETRWTEKNIDMDIDLPEVSIMGYQNLLFQVWTNIYSNAIKFSPEGSVITTKLEKTESGVNVSIIDHGIGMTEDQCRHIFDKFYQGDTAHKAEGNGLGLSISSKIISISQGNITVSSHPGKGSEFTVILPYSLAA